MVWKSKQNNMKTKKPIIIFRFHKEPVVCLNRLEILKHYNPSVPIYGIYGGDISDFPEHQKILKNYFIDIYVIKSDSSEWKWKNSDLVLLEWYNDAGKHIDFSMAFFIEWDLLLFGDIEDIYSSINEGDVGITGMIPLTKIENTWYWTSVEPHKSEWTALLNFVSMYYQYKAIPLASLGCGLCFPKSFLEKYTELYLPELCHDELRTPLAAQLLGFPVKDTGFMRDWLNPYEIKYFNCYKNRLIALQTIIEELTLKRRKAFHPFRDIFDLSNIL